MRPAGIAAFEARTPERTGVYSYEREVEPLSDDEIARFQADAAAWADWENRPPSYRRSVTDWITSAKQQATRERRLSTLIEDSRAGRRDQVVRLGAEGRMTTIDDALADASDRLRALDLGDAFEPRAAEAIVAAGLHRLVVPAAAGGLGARMSDAVDVLATLGAIDGSTALGFAMQVHVTGALVDSTGSTTASGTASSGRSSTTARC